MLKRWLVALCLLIPATAALAGSQEVTLGGPGNSGPIPLNLVGWNPVSLLLTFSLNSNLTCGVQVSNDGYNTRDPRGNPIPMINWNDHDNLKNLTASANGNIYFPIVAVRLIVTNWVAGTCTLAVAQVGP